MIHALCVVQVSVEAALAVSLDEFDAVAQAAYKAELSSISGVSPNLIELTITAASVHVMATFRGLDTVEADSAVQRLTHALMP